MNTFFFINLRKTADYANNFALDSDKIQFFCTNIDRREWTLNFWFDDYKIKTFLQFCQQSCTGSRWQMNITDTTGDESKTAVNSTFSQIKYRPTPTRWNKKNKERRKKKSQTNIKVFLSFAQLHKHLSTALSEWD